ncbi:AlpA family phage regulatory protein [Stutzerimonas kunmingensis]|uniref:AlpA family phage regulatory protein n=1 Tax=Stutzerimonas kunmingensis TaxID=1211807 RepID=UPI0037D92E01
MCSITSRCFITLNAGTAALCSYRQWILKSAISRAWKVSRKAGAIQRSTIYRDIKEGTFPKQFKLGCRSVGWLSTEVFMWMKGQNRA